MGSLNVNTLDNSNLTSSDELVNDGTEEGGSLDEDEDEAEDEAEDEEEVEQDSEESSSS